MIKVLRYTVFWRNNFLNDGGGGYLTKIVRKNINNRPLSWRGSRCVPEASGLFHPTAVRFYP